MAAESDKLAALRRQLAERFPSIPRTAGRLLSTGIPEIDETTGGLPLGAVTEIVCSAPSCGGQLLLGELLSVTRETRSRVALIDSSDSFDPASWTNDLLAHVVWIRCATTSMALAAVDLATRDANFGLVVLDLCRSHPGDLRRVPGPQWYRLQRAVEPTDASLVIQTPVACVPSAQLRFDLGSSFRFTDLSTDRSSLVATLNPALQRQRHHARLAG
jgi:hypothetical protein